MTLPFGGPAQEIEVGVAAAEPGPRTLAPFGRRLSSVSANEPVGAYRLLSVADPAGPEPLAGQFYMLASADGWGDERTQRPYLARAFSVCRAVAPERLEFLVDAIGPGTRCLATVPPGDRLWLVGPLGIGFSEPALLLPAGLDGETLLVGGGAGIAPLVIWEHELRRRGIAVRTVLGFRSAEYCAAAQLLEGGVSIATDDGAVGHHGPVTALLEKELRRGASVVYACGPTGMLEATRRICRELGVPAQLAMEQSMACGFGACFGCVVRTTGGYRRLCVDGPVVAAADLHDEWVEH